MSHFLDSAFMAKYLHEISKLTWQRSLKWTDRLNVADMVVIDCLQSEHGVISERQNNSNCISK